jgi:hypothetical protein
MGANLIPKVRNFSIDPNFTGDQHEIDDGCVPTGVHKVLRFDFVSQNVGNADFLIGRPVDRPDLFFFSAAHGHYHMKQFNKYKLYDINGNLVIPSSKPGFCLADVEKVPGMNPGPAKFALTCKADEPMGISAGWADVYDATLECQYLVIDGVPDGDYTLVAETNTAHAVPEDNFEDNSVCKGLRITGNNVQELTIPPLHVDLTPTTVNFNNVPSGETATRPVRFEVISCGPASFSIVTGPTKLTGPAGTIFGHIDTPGSSLGEDHTLLPRYAYIWLTYQGTADGDVATGEVKVKSNETGQQWTVPITANTVKPPTFAVMLALDQSNSMNDDAGFTGAKRFKVLTEAALRFTELIHLNSAFGEVRFDHNAYQPNDGTFPGFAITKISNDTDRLTARAALGKYSVNPTGFTSVGNGVKLAHDLVSKPAITGAYTKQAIIVFTDGLENRTQYIKDVMGDIHEATYAIGLGSAQQVNTTALATLTQATGGYLLLTDLLTSSIDHYFLTSKYFQQILADISKANWVVDPSGFIAPETTIRIPFVLNEADIECTVTLNVDIPIVGLAVETPAGDLITPANAAAHAVLFVVGTNMSYYRFTLPVAMGGGSGARTGTWHAILKVEGQLFRGGLSTHEDPAIPASAQTHGVRYSLNVQAYSNLRMNARIDQTSFEPGATLTLRARLTEYDLPVENRASVRTELQRPDNSMTTLWLAEVEPGIFETSVAATMAGVYHFHVLASGVTFREKPFTREQLLTGAAFQGGDDPLPTSDGRPDGGDSLGSRECCKRLIWLLWILAILLFIIILILLLRGR